MLVMVEITAAGLERLRQEDEEPAKIVQTGPGQYRVWVDFGEPFSEEQGELAAHLLTRRYAGDGSCEPTKK